MKRTIWLAVALVVVIGLVVILRSSSDHGGPPVQVSVQQLWQAPEAYQGTRVRTNGLLRVFAPGSASEYFVAEQAGQYRVGVRGFDRAVLEPLIGREVRIEGTLQIDSQFGIFIDAALVEPIAPASPVTSAP